MTNHSTAVDMRKFVEARNGEVFTSSQQVAEAFDKQHHHVMQKLEGLECSEHFLTSNFSRVKFEHRGNSYEACEMTKDGFMFLVMGFTGKKAAAIKEGYIAAFNWMADQLGLSSKGLVAKAVQEALGVEGARIISNVIRCRVAKLDPVHQRSASMKLSSALHARFNVPRIELIPGDRMDAACNFVASYAIEAEYLPKQDPSYRMNIHYPLDTLTSRRPQMLTDRGDGHAWLDVKVSDLRENFRSPCEGLLCELHQAGYDVAGAWWEVRTLRNKLRELSSFAMGMTRAAEEPQRYAVKAGEMA